MPIIYTYPSATPVAEDLLLISDVSATNPTKATRKCTIGDVVSLVTALVPGGGTVTSVGLQATGTGLTIATTTTNPITSTGVFTIGGTLVVGHGGTGATTLTGVLKGNGTAAVTASDVILTAGGTQEVTGILPEANGGTGESTYTKGDILYCDTTGASLAKLAIGADTNIMVVATDRPGWTTPTLAGLVTSIDVSGGTTGLTFSGGPITTTGTITMAGTLKVDNGGTERATLTQDAILLGAGVDPVQMIGPMADGQVLIGDTGTTPVAANITSTGATITITNGGGTINLEAAALTTARVNWDGQLTLRGGVSGLYTPNVASLAQYWTIGDYMYMEFYLEWNSVHGCVGTVIMEGLPPDKGTVIGISPLGATVEQGSCLVTDNLGWGTAAATAAPTVGRPGVTGADEILFRSMNFSVNFGQLEDCLWTHLHAAADPSLWKLAGTACWLQKTL